jgi:hypothetical protein
MSADMKTVPGLYRGFLYRMVGSIGAEMKRGKSNGKKHGCQAAC